MKGSFFIGICMILNIAVQAQEETELVGSNLTYEQAMEALDYHNAVRAEESLIPLEWSVELAVYSQDWADYLAFSKGCKMEHRPDKGEWKMLYGENIYWAGNPQNENHALKASEMWYSEKKNYKGKPLNERNLAQIGHYTQMMWHNTTQLGMGISICPNGDLLVVASYNPAGNYLNEKPF